MKKEQMVGSRLPLDLVRDLETIEEAEQTDRSTTVRKLLYRATKEWKLEYYAGQYRDQKISSARAANQAGVSLWEMLEYLRQKKITSQYDFDEWERDVKTVYERLGRRKSHGQGAGDREKVEKE